MIKQNLAFSAVSIMAFTIIEKGLAFFRETVFAYYYGTSVQSDAYVMSQNIPNVLFAVAGVAITTTVLPIYINKQYTH